jgi:hypothetical protein
MTQQNVKQFIGTSHEILIKHNNIEIPEHLKMDTYSKYDILALAFYFAQEFKFEFSQTMKDYADIIHEMDKEKGFLKDTTYDLLCKSFVDVYCWNKAKKRTVT